METRARAVGNSSGNTSTSRADTPLLLGDSDRSLLHQRGSRTTPHDILYTPWNDETNGEDVWYAVILPKLNKTGYVISSQADVTEKGAR